MDINISYKHKGDFYNYKITEKNFLGRPVEVNEGLFKLFYNCSTLILWMYVFTTSAYIEYTLCPKQGRLLCPGHRGLKQAQRTCVLGGNSHLSRQWKKKNLISTWKDREGPPDSNGKTRGVWVQMGRLNLEDWNKLVRWGKGKNIPQREQQHSQR